jgi:hypothetical protein
MRLFTRPYLASLSYVVFIGYREFNPRFVHDVHEVLYFFWIHRTAKRRDRGHNWHRKHFRVVWGLAPPNSDYRLQGVIAPEEVAPKKQAMVQLAVDDSAVQRGAAKQISQSQ